MIIISNKISHCTIQDNRAFDPSRVVEYVKVLLTHEWNFLHSQVCSGNRGASCLPIFFIFKI